jgi:YD repeat-containing protein
VLNRVTAVAMFKGSTAPSDCNSNYSRTGITLTAYGTDYSGSTVTVTDPAGKARIQSSDVLGRLVSVIEDPAQLYYQTTYNYDVLGNLTQVNQGDQTRTFSYSSLGRLRTASNPESGTISYSYYDSGDLHTKTDARQITTTMTYDPLHQILTKSYSDSTPAVTYEYYLAGNAVSPNIGQLKKVSSSAASTTYLYNQLGKVSASTNTISGFSGVPVFGYEYYLNGALKRELYPSGRAVEIQITIDKGEVKKQK